MPIQSFACLDTEALFTTGKSRRFVSIKSVAERKLAQFDAAPSVNFMKAPPGAMQFHSGGRGALLK